ncbi:MAG: HAD family hydrolase [Oscillospiraceae bacterium]|nr:HAD family hydrolase [Oscillospiraceae bacterium]
MAIKTVLFDLDGTLLPMDQDVFIKEYFTLLATKMAPYGYEPKKFIETIYNGVKAMVTNDGSCNNEKAFWNLFTSVYGEKAAKHEPVFLDFYMNEFQNVAKSCGFKPQANEIIKFCKEKGLRVILATNPLFPSVATESRMRWAGLDKEDFDYFTVYENSSYCKPNPKYYIELLDKIGADTKDCAMIGNDVDEDMITEKLGMKVFLLTDDLINKSGKDISVYPNGSFEQLKQWIEENA